MSATSISKQVECVREEVSQLEKTNCVLRKSLLQMTESVNSKNLQINELEQEYTQLRKQRDYLLQQTSQKQ